MATTTNLGLTLLEVGQKEKEATINANMTMLDTGITKYLGEFTTDQNTTGLVNGSTYYNTTTSKLMVLLSTNVWVSVA